MKQYRQNKQACFSLKNNLKIIPLGGMGEVGCNMTLFEYEGKILICDMGFGFPSEDMHGVDFLVPNATYLRGKEKNVVGMVFTHGHYDHIGAVPYLIKKIWRPNLEIFAAPLAKGIILKRQDDVKDSPKIKINEVSDNSRIKLGSFGIEFFKINHNIPDNLGMIIETPVGTIMHAGDFKFDTAPVNDLPTNFQKLENFSKRGVLLLMSDSTGAEEPGHSLSEKTIEKNLEEIFKKAYGRIFSATFASLINRIQQIITLSEKYGRKVVIEGYSMRTNVEISKQLGYIKTKKETIISAKEANNYPDSKITVLCTGAQGEGSAVLMRVTQREHPFLRFKKGDTVILSSSVVPGNERTVQNLKDNILRQGAKIFHYKMMDIHAGGHAQQEELKEMVRIIKPRFFMPIHGQYSMLVAHAELAKEAGMSDKNIVIPENGMVINVNASKIFTEKEKVPAERVMVDGMGIGDVGEIVLRDRQMLAADGMFVLVVVVDKKTGKVKGSPDIISRGFVYLRESKDLLRETRKKVIGIINKTASSNGAVNWTNLKEEIRSKVSQFLFSKTQRRPMVITVVIEV